jgi:hypothetical protein
VGAAPLDAGAAAEGYGMKALLQSFWRIVWRIEQWADRQQDGWAWLYTVLRERRRATRWRQEVRAEVARLKRQPGGFYAGCTMRRNRA